jgi:Tfp pilus assembly protein PilF
MSAMSSTRPNAATLFVVLTLAIPGCASDSMHREAMTLVQQGQEEAALAKLEAALEQDPAVIKAILADKARPVHAARLPPGRAPPAPVLS